MAANNEPKIEISEEDGCTNLAIYGPGFSKEQIRIQISPTRKLKIFGEQSTTNNNINNVIFHVDQTLRPVKLESPHTTLIVPIVEDPKVNGGVGAKKVIAKSTINLTLGNRRSCNANKKKTSLLKKEGIQVLWVMFILAILVLIAKRVGDIRMCLLEENLTGEFLRVCLGA